MKRLALISLVLVMAILSGCSNENQVKAWTMIDNGALVVDVRTPGEFRSGHLPDAKLIPIDQVSARIGEFGQDKTKPIVVYCKSGSRSGNAERILKSAGFTNVHNGGGFNALMSTKKELDSAPEKV